MKRHDGLIPLTHDHHHALAALRRLRLAAGEGAADRAAQTGEFLEFFRTETIAHFREEEEEVFPLIVDASEANGTIEGVLVEHLRIHAAVRSLRKELDAGAPSPAVMTRVASLLESHIRFEEKVVFPLIETIVGAERLASISLHPRDRTATRIFGASLAEGHSP